MKPEDYLDPANFPEELKWVPEHYKLHPHDPVYLLIAWHCQRAKAAEDTFKAAVADMKAGLDNRIAAMKETAKEVLAVGVTLAKVQEVLDKKPKLLGEQLDKELGQPVATALANLKELERTLTTVSTSFAVARRRQTLATLVIGIVLGVLGSLTLFLA